MERAGIETWPKLFQNLRASCSTELAQEFPAHVAAAWIGHSVEIANKHYWQVTDDDFARAVGKTKAAQNPAQQVHAGPRRGSQVTGVLIRKPLHCKALRHHAKPCKHLEWAIEDLNLS